MGERCKECKGALPPRDAKWAATCARLGLRESVLCDECAEVMWRQGQEQILNEARLDTLKATVARGDAPKEVLTVTYARFPDIEDKLMEWAAISSPAPNLYLEGETGTGKTWSCLAVLNSYAIDAGRSIAALSARQIAQVARFDDRRYRRWGGVDVCLVDDIDKVRLTEESAMTLWEFLDMRQGRVTLYTSNIPHAQLGRYISTELDTRNASLVAAMLDRMKPLTVIEMRGDSLRGC